MSTTRMMFGCACNVRSSSNSFSASCSTSACGQSMCFFAKMAPSLLRLTRKTRPKAPRPISSSSVYRSECPRSSCRARVRKKTKVAMSPTRRTTATTASAIVMLSPRNLLPLGGAGVGAGVGGGSASITKGWKKFSTEYCRRAASKAKSAGHPLPWPGSCWRLPKVKQIQNGLPWPMLISGSATSRVVTGPTAFTLLKHDASFAVSSWHSERIGSSKHKLSVPSLYTVLLVSVNSSIDDDVWFSRVVATSGDGRVIDVKAKVMFGMSSSVSSYRHGIPGGHCAAATWTNDGCTCVERGAVPHCLTLNETFCVVVGAGGGVTVVGIGVVVVGAAVVVVVVVVVVGAAVVVVGATVVVVGASVVVGPCVVVGPVVGAAVVVIGMLRLTTAYPPTRNTTVCTARLSVTFGSQ
mmetsp:Transcript_21733/g.67492  ORF Transcript_21733/g.67492 Transcript_21733/m.67492 type:complete len:409 (-) Transcript_21733:125-1351(-)